MNTENEEKRASLDSIKKEAPADMYSMTYYSSFLFDEYLKEGFKGNDAFIGFVTEKLLGSMEELSAIKSHCCSAFVCRNKKNEVLYCRNFDIEEFSPCCMLKTLGKDGYKSIGGTDISILCNSKTGDLALNRPFSLPALALPYRSHDGMNEYGVAASILMAGRAKTDCDGRKKMLSVLDVIRIILEKAKSVDEALDVLKDYTVDFHSVNDTPFHYFIADASGKSVVLEFGEGKPAVIESKYVTNFNLEGKPDGVGHDRYDTIKKTLEEKSFVINEKEAMNLLAKVCMKNMERYSVVYNLTNGDVTAFSHADPSVTAEFHLDMK